MMANIVLSLLHIVMLWVVKCVDSKQTVEIVFAVFLVIIYQCRSILGFLVDITILFEFLALLHLIIREKNQSIGRLLFLAKSADSSYADKKTIMK